MAKSKRQVYASVTHITDHQTGEISSSESTRVVRIPSEPPYAKVYLDDLSNLVGLTGGQTKLLVQLARKIDYDGLISLTPGVRKRMCERLGCSDQTLRNRLRELNKSGVIHRIGHSEYEANPHYFARGEWKKIWGKQQDFELRIRYSADGSRNVSTLGVNPED